MIPTARRSAAFIVLALVYAAGLANAAPALAAEPPAGIRFDAPVRVIVREPSPDGGATPGAVISGASVTVIAYLTDFEDDPVQVKTGRSDASGAVAFTGVARPDVGGPPVHLAVEAIREIVATDPDTGCVETRSWFGLVTDVATPASVTVVASPASSLACPPTRVLAGRILGPDGSPLDAATATVSVVLPPAGGAQAFPLRLARDGSFAQDVPSWGTSEHPALVTVRFVSAPTRDERGGDGCVERFAQQVTWTGELALAEIAQPPFLALVTEEFLVGEQCGAVSSAAPAAVKTLPPTDEPVGMGGDAAARIGLVVAFLGLLVVAVIGVTLLVRRARA